MRRLLLRRTAGSPVVRRCGTCVLGLALLWAPAARGEDEGSAEATDAPAEEFLEEDSVLVLTQSGAGPLWDAEPDEEQDDQIPLSPEALVSDHEPELADPEPSFPPTHAGESRTTTDAGSFGAALKSGSKTFPEQVAKVASLPQQEPTSSPGDLASSYRDGSQLAEPAKFNGIQPGATTRQGLLDAWGEPVDSQVSADGEILQYEIAPFSGVNLKLRDDIVRMIKVELQQPEEPRQLARKLRMERVVPVDILDETTGELLGIAYPERGVLLLVDSARGETMPSEPLVSHMIVQPLDPTAFVLRAEKDLHGPYEQNLRDLEQAISLDPQDPYACWLLAEICLATGRADAAERAASQALEMESQNDAFRLTWACALGQLGQYDQAVLQTRDILDNTDTPEVIRAQALHEMGNLASLGSAEIAEKAIGFHTMAIELADKHATSNDSRTRRVAKNLLVDAHLAVAREVARRSYARKIETVSQWIGRASGLAEEMIANDNGSLELRLRVAEHSLAALASLKPTKDPEPWIKEAQETADAILQNSTDELQQSCIRWRLGIAYLHALRAEHTRQQADRALAYGQTAIQYLAEGAKQRDSLPEAENLVGQLYFHMGAVHAVYKKDHDKAITWYEKACPLLLQEAVPSELIVPRRQGEALVSMAVSYWHQGEKWRALELTSSGADLIERAVAGGILDQSSLAVPYSNLATMHKQLGNTSEAAKYSELAKAARANGASETLGDAAPPHAQQGPQDYREVMRNVRAGATPPGSRRMPAGRR